MKILKIILFSLLGIMFAFLLSNLFFDEKFTVETSATIKTSPFVAYDQIENFENWPNWDPWMAVDSTVTISLDDNVRDLGAIREWKSKHSGNGYLKQVSKMFLEHIDYEIHIDKSSPFYTTFSFESDSIGVKVNWKHYGELPFLSRVFGPFFKKMIQSDQTNGLNNIKKYCESLPSQTSDISVEKFLSQKVIYIEESCPTSKLNESLSNIYNTIFVALAQNGIMPTSLPFVQYIQFPNQSGQENTVKFKAGVFVEVKLKETLINGDIQYIETPTTMSVQATHIGDLRTINDTHHKIKQYCLENGYKVINLPYEVYLTDPNLISNASEWKTKVIYQIE